MALLLAQKRKTSRVRHMKSLPCSNLCSLPDDLLLELLAFLRIEEQCDYAHTCRKAHSLFLSPELVNVIAESRLGVFAALGVHYQENKYKTLKQLYRDLLYHSFLVAKGSLTPLSAALPMVLQKEREPTVIKTAFAKWLQQQTPERILAYAICMSQTEVYRQDDLSSRTSRRLLDAHTLRVTLCSLFKLQMPCVFREEKEIWESPDTEDMDEAEAKLVELEAARRVESAVRPRLQGNIAPNIREYVSWIMGLASKESKTTGPLDTIQADTGWTEVFPLQHLNMSSRDDGTDPDVEMELKDKSSATPRWVQLPFIVPCFQSLRSLKVSNQSVFALPSDIGRLLRLEDLDLSINQLTSLPASIENLSRLHTLNLSHNCFKHVPTQIKQLHNLTCVSVDDNPIDADCKGTFPCRAVEADDQNCDLTI